MSATCASSRPAISIFERYLTVWVARCIVVGILLGQIFPHIFTALAAIEIAQVNLPVGLLMWIMIIPMLLIVGIVNRSKGWYEQDPASLP